MKLKRVFTIALFFAFGTVFSQNQHFVFYESSTGSADMYTIATHGGLGSKFNSINNGWRTTWTDIEYYRAGEKNLMLFYQASGGGFAEMYEIKSDGNLGNSIGSTSNWKATWTDIEYYRAGGKDMLLFYEASSGSAAMYEVANDGGLGKKVNSTTGWRTTWTDIEYYRAGNKDMFLFYQGSDGYAVMYEVASHGSIGRKVTETHDWKNTWSDIEYYSTARQAKRKAFPLGEN
jgi:hypothetical protein